VARVFVVKAFDRFAKNTLGDAELLTAIDNAEDGRSVNDLGGGLYKVRIAQQGGGKSGGYRTLVAIRSRERSVFLHGFAKNDLDNIGKAFLTMLKELAKEVLSRNDDQVGQLLESGAWREIVRPYAPPPLEQGHQDHGDEEEQYG